MKVTQLGIQEEECFREKSQCGNPKDEETLGSVWEPGGGCGKPKEGVGTLKRLWEP